MSKISEYDRALVLGNRLQVNIAIQSLETALRNLRAVDNGTVLANVHKVERALADLREYNRAMVDLGVS